MLGPTFRDTQGHTTSPLPRQPLFYDMGVFIHRVLEEYLPWHMGGRVVELLDELRQYLRRLIVLGAFHEKVLPPCQLPATDEVHLHPGFTAASSQGNHVLVRLVARHHLLALAHSLYGLYLVTEQYRALELQVIRGCRHLPVQVTEHLIRLALHEQHHLLYDLPVLLFGHRANARPNAPVDVKFQAWPGVCARYQLCA